MRKTTAKIMIAVMLSSSIVAVAPDTILPTAHAEQVIHTNLSKPVSIENLGTMELKTIFTVPSTEGQVITFSLDIANTGNQLIDFTKYWLRLQSTDGTKFQMRWVDQSKKLIYPGQRQTVHFYTVLPKNVSMSNVKLRLIKFDSSVASFERDLGEMPINAAIIPTLGRSVSKYIGLTNNQIEARVDLGDQKTNEKQTEVNYTLHLINKGQQSLELPAYEYILVTNTGLAYPLTVDGSSEGKGTNQLLPWIEEELELKGVVPSAIDLKNVALYILYPHGDDRGKVLLPVTVFRTFEQRVVEETPTNADTIALGTNAELILRGDKKNEESKTSLVVSSVQRFPWDHRDLLSAKVKLTNTGDTKVAIPQLKGQFVLGNNYEVNAEVILNTVEQTHLNAGDSITYQVLGYIPYTSSFREAHLVLKEREDSAEYKQVIKTKQIPHVTFTERATQIAQMDPNSTFVIGDATAQSSIKLGEASSYISSNGKFVVSRMVVTNLELRGRDVPKLIGFYKTKQGIFYPAIMSRHEEQNFPRGSSILTFYAEFPEEVKQEELQLIIGEEIKDKGFKNGVSYQLPVDTTKVVDKIDSINFYPYTLKFTDLFADYKNGFSFKLKKEKANNSKASLEDRRLVMEFTNLAGYVFKTEEVKLEGSGAWGEQVKIPIPTDITEINNTIYVFNVTIYDEFEGSRKALAKQSFAFIRYNNE